jgi:hypothetical protein
VTQVSVSSVAYEPRLRLVRDEKAVEAEGRAGRNVSEIAVLVPKRPLVVDLDGTLVRSDLLIETAFSELGARPQSVVDMVRASFREGCVEASAGATGRVRPVDPAI